MKCNKKDNSTTKVVGVYIFAIVLAFCFARIPSPTFANNAPSEALQTVYQMTRTSAITVYLPIVVRSPEPPAELKITTVLYSGRDEYVQIKNIGVAGQSMDGWKVVSLVGPQTYNFPNGITLAQNESLRIHSGPDAVNYPPHDLFWSTSYTWNNQGDKAQLVDDQSGVRDTYCYKDGC